MPKVWLRKLSSRRTRRLETVNLAALITRYCDSPLGSRIYWWCKLPSPKSAYPKHCAAIRHPHHRAMPLAEGTQQYSAVSHMHVYVIAQMIRAADPPTELQSFHKQQQARCILRNCAFSACITVAQASGQSGMMEMEMKSRNETGLRAMIKPSRNLLKRMRNTMYT
jgi:hypothetical protein